jgi:peptide/nickel transport system permease protein
VCTYPAGSSPPGPGCYQTPANNPSEIAPTINFATFSAGPLPLGSLTVAPTLSSGFLNIYAGLLRGSDWSLIISTAIVGGGAMVGLVVGAISGFYGGVVDEALMRLVDIFLSIPQILFVIIVIAVITTSTQSLFGLGPQNSRILLLILGFLVTWWPFYARVVRGQVLVVREQKYVESARAAGASQGRIIRRHIIPNSVYPVFIQMSLDVGTIPLLIGALIFLGFSLFTTPFFPEWGAISANSVRNLQAILLTCIQATGCVIPWWQLLFPGLVLFMFAISVNFLSDGLRDALDPRLRR